MPKSKPASVRLSEDDAATILGMLARGDRQSDIAQFFGVNQGQVAKVKSGAMFRGTVPKVTIPEPGPYRVVGASRFDELEVAAALPASLLRKLVADIAYIKEALNATYVLQPGRRAQDVPGRSEAEAL